MAVRGLVVMRSEVIGRDGEVAQSAIESAEEGGEQVETIHEHAGCLSIRVECWREYNRLGECVKRYLLKLLKLLQ